MGFGATLPWSPIKTAYFDLCDWIGIVNIGDQGKAAPNPISY